MFETEIIFEKIRKTLSTFNNLELSFRQLKGVQLFPSFDVIESLNTGSISYEIRYNPRIDYVLKLYNLALFNNLDISNALYHYILFNAYIECDDYVNAENQLNHVIDAKVELDKLNVSITSDEEECDTFIQKYFMLLHEAVHCVLIHESNNRNIYIDDTIRYLKDVSDFESALEITNDDIINHPSFKKHIEAIIPKEFPEELKNKYENYYTETVISKQDELFIGYLINNEHFLEEVTCDRLAWINMMNLCKPEETELSELIEIHKRIIAALYIMSFNESTIQSITPGSREKYIYPSHFINIRHKALKRLLEFRLLKNNLSKSPYKSVDQRIEMIFRGFIRNMGIHNDVSILSQYDTTSTKRNRAIYSRLNSTMEELLSK